MSTPSSVGLRPSRSAVVAVFLTAVLAAGLLFAEGCSRKATPPQQTVVVYTSLDQVYSEPILAEFERQTGIKVLPVYDAEASKTTGLVNRLIARRDRPDCDVFWSNEIVQTERLAQMGLLESYASPQSERFPQQFRDPQNRWTGFAARMRVIIYNVNMVPTTQAPRGLDDFLLPLWRGQCAIARPFFGTTLTHAAVLHQQWGPQRLVQYMAALRGNGVALCSGNATVRDMVAAGEKAFGLTDTDDAYGAILEGKPVQVVIPDAGTGALLIPNTVALVKGSPNSDAGRKLIDYLLSAQVERRLAQSSSAQIPLATDLADLATPWDGPAGRPAPMPLDVQRAAAAMPDVVNLLRDAGMDR